LLYARQPALEAAAPPPRPEFREAVQPPVQPIVQPVVAPAVQLVVEPPPQPPIPAADQALPAQLSPTTAHYLQLGAFSARGNAEAASMQLRRQLDWLQVPIEIQPHGSLFRVQAGPFALRESAARVGLEVRARTGLRPLLLPRTFD
jgi:cell division septation protein DedD